MSFRDLKDEIYLVLQIKSGHGFGFATSPLIVTANLAGNLHESFIIEPCPQPKFESEFVWVMDKAKMKSIWSDKIPIRVECFTVFQSRRSRLGYIILNVKDAQIVQDESKLTEKQVRLLGLSREVSLLKPELVMTFYITDIPIRSPHLVPQFSPSQEDKQPIRMDDKPIKVSLGSSREHFNLVITPGTFSNLKELLPSQLDVDPELVTYTYSLLGAEVISDVSTHHSVKLAISSSLSCLKTYFIRQPHVNVRFHMGSLLVGETTISMENLLLGDDLQLRKNKHHTRSMNCHCVVISSQSVSETPPESKPCVDFSVTFSCDNPVIKKKPAQEVLSVASLSSVGAGGDADNRVDLLPLESPVTIPLVTQSRPGDSGGDTYRTKQSVATHTVNLTLTRLCLEPPTSPHSPYWLRLSHPCAAMFPAQQIAVTDNLEPLQWQLTLTVPRHLLEPTLTAQPVILQLGAGDIVMATAQLMPPDTLSAHPGCEHMLALQREDERVGEVSVRWALGDGSSKSATLITDQSMSLLTHSQNVAGMDILSPRARELKILSFVEELEDWAEKQRTIVMEGLKEEEAARLTALQSQWEAEVGGQVSEGRQLVDALHNMRDQLRQQETELRENQHKLKIYKEELERVHRSKLQEFKDLSRRMQDEFNHKLALIATDKVALEREVEVLREQNSEMKQKLREVERSVDSDKKLVGSLGHELKMLKEKLNMEQESKKFFKDHCRKAEQEIHRLNSLRQQEMEARLHDEKKSLEQLAFQQIIVERNDLRQDQRLLEEIRQQLLRPDTISGSNGETTYADGRPLTDERHIRRAT